MTPGGKGGYLDCVHAASAAHRHVTVVAFPSQAQSAPIKAIKCYSDAVDIDGECALANTCLAAAKLKQVKGATLLHKHTPTRCQDICC